MAGYFGLFLIVVLVPYFVLSAIEGVSSLFSGTPSGGTAEETPEQAYRNHEIFHE